MCTHTHTHTRTYMHTHKHQMPTCTHTVAHSQEFWVTRQNEEDPIFHVPSGGITFVGYSVTYHSNSTNHYMLQLRNGRRNIPHYNPQPSPSNDLEIINLEVSKVSTRRLEAGLVTDWYVLFINGTEQVQGVVVNCNVTVSGGPTGNTVPCERDLSATILVTGGRLLKYQHEKYRRVQAKLHSSLQRQLLQ